MAGENAPVAAADDELTIDCQLTPGFAELTTSFRIGFGLVGRF